MIKCIAVYPHTMSDEYRRKVKYSIALAKKYDFDEIFTTVHLPEYTFEQQLETLEIIAEEAKKNKLEVTVDIGGHYIEEILNNVEYLEKVKKIGLDFIRLDYGYHMDQVTRLYEELNLKGFVINASIYSQDEVDTMIADFKKLNPEIELRACHNFYIREESGIDGEFALKQDSYLKKYNLPIYYCVESKSNPRGPLYAGLCTVEKHRGKEIRDVLCDLYLNYNLSAFMMSDEWLSENEYKEVKDTLDYLTMPLKDVEEIRIKLTKDIDDDEKSIVLKEHQFRYDSPFGHLRSQSSRQMAEFAKSVKPHNTIARKKGTVTIDNVLYRRYSGELQVVLKDSEADDRANVVGIVENDIDLIKMMRFREGHRYVFVEEN